MEQILIDKGSYDKVFKNLFDGHGINSNKIIQTKVELPFELPFKEGYCIVSPFPESSNFWSFLYFSNIDIKEESPLNHFDSIRYLRRTVVNLCVISELQELDIEEKLIGFFDASLLHLNSIISSYAIHFQDETTYELTKFDLKPICQYEIIDVSTWESRVSLLVLHDNVEFVKSELDKYELSKLSRFSNYLNTNDYIFLMTEKYFLMAKNKFSKGHFSEAVIFSQIAIEVKLKRMFYYFLEKENLAEKDINDIMESTPFISIVKKEMSKRLGGVWDISKEGSEVYDWYVKCYSLRNQTIHIGYSVNEFESKEAIRSAMEFALYIAKLIRAKKKHYPELMAGVEIIF